MCRAWGIESVSIDPLGSISRQTSFEGFGSSIGGYQTRSTLLALGILLFPFLFGAIVTQLTHYAYAEEDQEEKCIPRTVPYKLPYLKSTIPFFFGGLGFFDYVSRFCSGRAVVRISFFRRDIYLISGAKNVAEFFRQTSLSTAPAYGIALQNCFGMAKKPASVYFADTSGSRSKPIQGSNVQPKNRVMYRTHESLSQGLLGTGLAPASDRFEQRLAESLKSLCVSDEWVTYPDFLSFMEGKLGTAIVGAVFGSVLLSQNPDFIRDLWVFDDAAMGLAKRLPALCMPNAYRARRRLLHSIKEWHAYATKSSSREDTAPDGDIDSLWGSRLMRERNRMLLDVEDQDRDSVASTDLGLIWAFGPSPLCRQGLTEKRSVTNVVPSSMTMIMHVLRDTALCSAIRRDLLDSIEPGPRLKFDCKKLEKQPLLLSTYAETLRFGVEIHVPRATPHKNLSIGKMLVPRDSLAIVNTWLAHNDPTVWNTKKDAFLLESFWAQRFLVDPMDPSSGPLIEQDRRQDSDKTAFEEKKEIRFSKVGLEGSWIPFGGGHHACPGRILAKRIMLLSCAMTLTLFDIDILAEEEALMYGSPRFGFGVRKPKGKVPFRLKRRIHLAVT
ncbi:MAG: hypothetical protein Q9226_007865 [Calogaya cf. arnoldii]